jgi:hypothetical protein
MTRLLSALFAVLTGRAQRIAAPGEWRVWRDDAGLHIEVLNRK